MAKPSLPQFDPNYDVYKMRQLVDELNRWIETVESGSSGAGGGEAEGEHNILTGRDAADAHPIVAISGLQSALDAKANQSSLDALEIEVDANTFAISVLDDRVDVNEITIALNTAAIVANSTAIDLGRTQRYFFGE